MNRALAKGGVDGNTLYNLGCVLSLMGKKERAILLIEQSMEQRVMYRRQMAEDADLDPIRDDPRFLKVIEKAK